MKLENEKFLEENKHFWDTLKNAGYLKGISAHVKNEMLRVYREEWYPRYLTDLFCPPCIADMIRKTYSQYELYLERKEQLQKLAAEEAKTAQEEEIQDIEEELEIIEEELLKEFDNAKEKIINNPIIESNEKKVSNNDTKSNKKNNRSRR